MGDVIDSRICVTASVIGADDVSKEVLMDGRVTNEDASGRRVDIGTFLFVRDWFGVNKTQV